jgi:hypothetical protein
MDLDLGPQRIPENIGRILFWSRPGCPAHQSGKRSFFPKEARSPAPSPNSAQSSKRPRGKTSFSPSASESSRAACAVSFSLCVACERNSSPATKKLQGKTTFFRIGSTFSRSPARFQSQTAQVTPAKNDLSPHPGFFEDFSTLPEGRPAPKSRRRLPTKNDFFPHCYGLLWKPRAGWREKK